jgi:type IV pilus assembly protein PilM
MEYFMFGKFQKWLSSHVRMTYPPLIGVDITPNAIKLLAFEPAGKTHRIRHYAMAMLELGVIVDRKIKQPAKVSAAIVAAMQKAKCDLLHAAIALPAANVITKVIQVNATLSETELEEEVEREAENIFLIPWKISV